MNKHFNKEVYTVIQVFLFKSLFFLPFICLKSFGSHAWLFPCLVSSKYPVDDMPSLWKTITLFHKDEVPEIIKLAQYALTLPLHTCCCERVFSNQNLKVTRLRSRLNPKISDRLFRSETSKPSNHTVVKFACFRSNLQHVQYIFLIWMSWFE
jgi:hypothetical protein